MASLGGARVVIFKGETERTPDPYVEELQKCGFRPRLVPNITFDFFDLHILEKKLRNPNLYSGMILSSERCVEAVERAVKNINLLDSWQDKLVVCAGEASAQKTRQKLGLEPLLGDKHRAEGIIDLLANRNPLPNLILYPCGELAANKDTMASGLAARGIKCEPTPVYKTVPNPALKKSLSELFPTEKAEEEWPKIIVFFSPSGLRAVLENIENCEDLNSCKFASIGPTTTSAIKESGFTVWAEADQPNPHSLRVALEKAQQN